MRVLNVHERDLTASAAHIGTLLDTLASEQDALWPRHAWPRMHLDRALAPGARGGHGPIRYHVESYAPGRSVWFRFDGPRGFDGGHGLEIEPRGPARCLIRHTLAMRTHGPALLSWPLVFRPLHDALIEDALDRAALAAGCLGKPARWSWYVRGLRALMGARKPAPPLDRSRDPAVVARERA